MYGANLSPSKTHVTTLKRLVSTLGERTIIYMLFVKDYYKNFLDVIYD